MNGGLFANENIEIPQFTDEILDLVLRKGSEDFDWKDISPTIFGAVFESTLNPETRRSGGMHYTSVANIHKVIDPLFLDDLTRKVNDVLTQSRGGRGDAEKAIITSAPQKLPAPLREKLIALQGELASLTFLDPACGSGIFLTETYISLRRLENRILSALLGPQGVLWLEDSQNSSTHPLLHSPTSNLVRVFLSQFRGIEINDFAVKVAKTALWIAENQMLRETEAIAHRNLDFLPLKNYDGIVEGNALRLDWPRPDYIIGNPPFSGARWMGKSQKDDVSAVFGQDWPGVGDLDYVCCWFKKAADCMMAESSIRTAFVATNSISQGTSPANLWKPLVDRFRASIDFAHRTFRWDSESNSKAHVHCVIVGFHVEGAASPAPAHKPLFDGERVSYVPHINAYLFPADDIWLDSPTRPVCAAPEMTTGNRPADGGALIIEDEDLAPFLKRDPTAGKFIKRLAGSAEFINGKKRWFLWLVGASPQELLGMPAVMERVAQSRDNRLAAPDPGRRKLADTPTLFRETLNPATCVAIPEVSSESRRYVPIGFLGPDTITTNKIKIIPNATLYHFGVVTSNVHNAWMRTICGRLKSDYRYSGAIVYNNFPWPEISATKNTENTKGEDNLSAPLREKIFQTAEAILDARAAHPDCPLKVLYNELTMPPDLRRAHQENDRAVMAAYGFSTKMTESECVAELFKRYQALSAMGDQK